MAPGLRLTGGKDFPYFIFHRLSAIGTFLFFLSRFWLAASITAGHTPGLNSLPYLIQFAISLFDSLLMACVFFHAANGLRQVVADLFIPSWYEKIRMRRLIITTLILTGLVWVIFLSAMILRFANVGVGAV